MALRKCPNCGSSDVAVEKWTMCPHCGCVIHFKINKKSRVKKAVGHQEVGEIHRGSREVETLY